MEVFYFTLVSEDHSITSNDVGKCTTMDFLLSKVRDSVWHGWRDSSDLDLLPFINRKDELSVDNCCLLWGTRVDNPENLQDKIVRLLHDQHPGITRMKLLAHSYVWWPGIEQAIQKTVSSCYISQCTRNAAPKVPLQQWPQASGRWQRKHIVFLEIVIIL